MMTSVLRVVVCFWDNLYPQNTVTNGAVRTTFIRMMRLQSLSTASSSI